MAVEGVGAVGDAWRLGLWGIPGRRAAVLCGTSVLLGNLLSAPYKYPTPSTNCPGPTLADRLILFHPIFGGTKRIEMTKKKAAPSPERRVEFIEQLPV